jgi:serine phosphatase RsbU (regulator of sigma subunit)/Tfp pilus assembly protein PilF
MNIKNVFILLLLAPLFSDICAQTGSLDSLKSAFKSEINDSLRVHLLLNIALNSASISNEDAKAYTIQALNLAKGINYNKGMAMSYNHLGVIERNSSNYASALNYHNLALQYISPYGICSEKANILNNIGVVYRRLSELSKAADFHLRALSVAEEVNDSRSINIATNSLGNIYLAQGNYTEALKHFEKSLQREKATNNSLGIAINLNNIGAVYAMQKEYAKAVSFYSQSLEINKKIGDKKGISICYNCLGEMYSKQQQYKKAIAVFKKSLDLNLKLGDKIYTASNYINIGDLHTSDGNYPEAETNIRKGLEIAMSIGSKQYCEEAYSSLSDLYSKKGEYKAALDALRSSITYKDSIINENSLNTIAHLRTVYETEKKEKEIQAQKLELAIKKKEVLKEKALKLYFISAFIAMLLVSLLIYHNYRLKKKVNIDLVNYNRDMDEKNRILTMQKEEILSQRDQIEEKNKVVNKAYDLIKNKNKNIIDNIRYALQIQNALLPPLKKIKQHLPESFIFYKPRDIVSGDFYWLFQKGQRLVVAVGDCTGHGVSGAFMSILGITTLNEIVNEKGITKPDQILNHLRDRIIWSLQQENKFWEAKDGMDMTIFSFDFIRRKVMFSGANSSAMLIRDNTIKPFKGDKMPVSIFPEIVPFSLVEVDICPNDMFYLYTDGYYHQFGGLYGKKFSVNQFSTLLLDIHKLDLRDQQIRLEDTFRRWRTRNEQVDDILVMGFQITEEMLQNGKMEDEKM